MGFSFGGDPAKKNDTSYSHDEVAENMIAFLTRFDTRFPNSHNGELYIFAESFGGHYAPVSCRGKRMHLLGCALKNTFDVMPSNSSRFVLY